MGIPHDGCTHLAIVGGHGFDCIPRWVGVGMKI